MMALAADGGGDQDGCARPAAPIANVTINIPSIGDSVTNIDHAFGAKFARRSSAFLVGSEPALDPVQARPRQDPRRRGRPIDGELSLSYRFRGPLRERLNGLAAGHRPCFRRSG